jgi:hypothetical protein
MREVQKFSDPSKEGYFRVTGRRILSRYVLTMRDGWSMLTLVPISGFSISGIKCLGYVTFMLFVYDYFSKYLLNLKSFRHELHI